MFINMYDINSQVPKSAKEVKIKIRGALPVCTFESGYHSLKQVE